MAKTSTVPFSQNFNTRLVTLNTASSFIATDAGTSPTNTVELLTAGDNDSIVKSITISSSDTVARTIAFYISSDIAPTQKHLLFTIPAPGSSGFSGTVSNVDVLGSTLINGFPVDQSGKNVLLLKAGFKLWIGVITAAITANKNVYVQAFCEDF